MSKKEKAEWREWSDKCTAIDLRVEAALGHKLVVNYVAYEEDERGMPIDNLDDVAIVGRVRLIAAKDDWGGEKSRSWEGKILESPTWLTIVIEANAMMRRTRNLHHCFLEGFEIVHQEGDVQIANFVMGS